MHVSKLPVCLALVLGIAGSAYAMTDGRMDNIRLAFATYSLAPPSVGRATGTVSLPNVTEQALLLNANPNRVNKVEATQSTPESESNAAAMVLGGLVLIGYVAFRRARNSRLHFGRF